ncbi:protein phosphatase 1 regulatory subunit 12C [Echinops telfairi]|uniref:Protein phosphatase 1 regulatory subunit 12C n=1 Tax=Echinops telfairi TaxID=9371 RepID=A0AC55D9A0_ECHTE|nr:protein phosphatase 1 regulatory subunit 12C [Echinops telfairi]
MTSCSWPSERPPAPQVEACIDENLEVVRFLVEQGATVNQADNEGWTPLHVAASCGYLDIARYLLSHGANIAAVNSDGDLPLDLAESDAMEGLLRAEIAHRGVDVEAAKRAEEELLLHDTRCWLNGGAMPEARHPRTGASALHVAAAKGYIEVMRLLLQAGYDTELRDGDGWTPLHAAAHWGVEDACRLLAEHGGGMDSLTHACHQGTFPEMYSSRLELSNSVPAQRPKIPEPEPPVKPNTSGAPPTDSRDRRRSYQMPVRDEESESQRKARSRLMRQSRRSTQGVTLTDLKEAEKVTGKSPEPEAQSPPSLDHSRRPQVPGLEPSEGPAERAEAPEGQGPPATREPRRAAKERRGPAEGEEAELVEGVSESSTPDGPTPRRQRPRPKSEAQEEPDGGFRKLYAELRVENERLREALTETTLQLSQLKVELEKATQKHERFAERPALLELERFERRALERKAAELEEELKALSDLRADNQRLKDENAALIRVISKLSK